MTLIQATRFFVIIGGLSIKYWFEFSSFRVHIYENQESICPCTSLETRKKNQNARGCVVLSNTTKRNGFESTKMNSFYSQHLFRFFHCNGFRSEVLWSKLFSYIGRIGFESPVTLFVNLSHHHLYRKSTVGPIILIVPHGNHVQSFAFWLACLWHSRMFAVSLYIYEKNSSIYFPQLENKWSLKYAQHHGIRCSMSQAQPRVK